MNLSVGFTFAVLDEKNYFYVSTERLTFVNFFFFVRRSEGMTETQHLHNKQHCV